MKNKSLLILLVILTLLTSVSCWAQSKHSDSQRKKEAAAFWKQNQSEGEQKFTDDVVKRRMIEEKRQEYINQDGYGKIYQKYGPKKKD